MDLVDDYEDVGPQDNPEPEQQVTKLVEASPPEETKDAPPMEKDTPFCEKVPQSLPYDEIEIKRQFSDA